MYDTLINHFRQIIPLEEGDEVHIKNAFKVRELSRKEILLHKGDQSNHMRFIVGGSMKAYTLDENGGEHILQLGVSGWWVNDLYSFLTRTPAEFVVQAIEPSVLLQVHRDQLEVLYHQVPMIERFFRIKIQNAYVALQERTVKSMHLTAEARYQEFITKYRSLEQQVPQYMVASYLGITPEHLSTIRKKLSESERS